MHVRSLVTSLGVIVPEFNIANMCSLIAARRVTIVSGLSCLKDLIYDGVTTSKTSSTVTGRDSRDSQNEMSVDIADLFEGRPLSLSVNTAFESELPI